MDQAKLKEELSYSPETGLFMWLKPKKKRRLDIPAGTYTPDGYLKITVDGVMIPGHRLAWIYVYGHIPDGMVVDHINGNPRDNSIANLRICTRAQNNQNRRWTRKNDGLIGINFDKRRGLYRAQIATGGRVKFLGYFSESHEAHAAYVAAKRELHEFCTI